jgi:hypothetical protein
VHGHGVDVALAEALDEPVRTALGADEDEREAALGVAQLVLARGDLGLVRHAVEAVLDVTDLLGRRGVLVAHRIVRVGGGDPADLALERGREEQRLALTRGHGDDLVDDGLEAHVEHPVGLVEHEHLDRAEVDRAAVDQVHEAARGGDQHVRARGLLGLVVDADAAVHGGDLERAGVHHAGELVDDLRRELAGRREDQRGRPGAVGVEAVGHRHAEGERLARAGRRLDEDVLAVEDVRDDHGLDGERRLDAALAQGLGHRTGYAEAGERGRHWGSSFSPGMGCRGVLRGRGDSTDPNRAFSERLQGQRTSRAADCRTDAQRSSGVRARTRRMP